MEMTTEERHVKVLESLGERVIAGDDDAAKEYNAAYKMYIENCKAADENDRESEKVLIEKKKIDLDIERFEHEKAKAKKDFWISVAGLGTSTGLVVTTLLVDLKGVISNKNSFNWAKNVFDKMAKTKIK